MAGDRNRSCIWTVGVPILPVVATRPVLHPAVVFHRLDYVSNLHSACPLHTVMLRSPGLHHLPAVGLRAKGLAGEGQRKRGRDVQMIARVPHEAVLPILLL